MLFSKADPCLNYKNLGDANRKSSYGTPHEFGHVFCDDFLPGGGGVDLWGELQEQASCFRAVSLIN